MPFINVIQGEKLPNAPLNVVTPIMRIPLWMAITWWCVKTLAVAVFLACRFWYITGPAGLLLWLYAKYDWYGPAGLLAGLTLLLAAWWYGHRASCRRFCVYPAWSRWRRLFYRRRWLPAMHTAKLTVAFDGHVVVPILKRVRTTGAVDVLTVRMVSGQIPDDFAKVGDRLAHTFGVLSVRVTAGTKPDLVMLAFRRRDALTAIVPPFPVPAVPDFTALPVAMGEDGDTYALRLFGSQVLIVGATDAGKGSAIWSIIRAVAGGIRSGLVHVWAFDPKGGMELGGGMPLFARFACKDFAAMADMLEEAVATMQQRTDRLRGQTRQHIPTVDDPLYLIIIDELAALTAYLTNRQLKDRIKAALGTLLTQGRAVGVHVVACLQDPRKEVLPFRNLFPTRIGLRLSEPGEVDLVLGEGARDRGALCDRIPKGPTAAGIGYVVLDGDPTPTRIRFSYLTDDDITALAHDYGRLRVIDGEATDRKDGAA
jgi:hypothetical protein